MSTETVHRPTTATLDQFWKAISIWNQKPHVVNRRLCGAMKVVYGKLNEQEDKDTSLLFPGIKNALSDAVVTDVTATWVSEKLSDAGIQLTEVEENCKDAEPGKYIYIKKLVPRNCDLFSPCLELVIKDTASKKVTFMGLLDTPKGQTLTPSFPYHFQYIKSENKQKIQLVIENEGCTFNSSVDWLKEHVFNKVVRWAETAVINEDRPPECVNPESSLSLVNIVKYNELYQKLKKKYGPEMVKIWPEKTDPLKFVYEDVAIATYLLLLWEEERQKSGTEERQPFVDLGCGNGLLVHILSSEGHPGKGIDVRKRTIWGIYPDSTKLEVQPITPSDEFLYPEADWLIGNHSDELTAWIPIIAARSSYKCKFFILPCCPYELNGHKYQRVDSSRSQYGDYMNFLLELCKVCGFIVNVDRLRIPSTKRTCLVGAERTYAKEDGEKTDQAIKDYIQSKIKDKDNKGAVSEICKTWSDSFQPRSGVERIRNCTRLDKNMVEEIIILITKQLLIKKRMVLVTSSGGQEKTWNAGGTCSLSELAGLITSKMLKKLKNECGGLKTLLKNHSHVFNVEGKQVRFRVPGQQALKVNTANREIKFKQKPCWFHNNHPEGCPLVDEDCTFKH